MSMKNPSTHRIGVLSLILVLLSAGCGLLPQTSAAAPTPQVYDSPAGEITTFIRYFQQGCHFGGAVDIDKEHVVAGAPCWAQPPGEAAGSALVIRRSSAGELQKEAALFANDRDDGFQYDQHFGEAVALNGKLIAVGAPGYDDPKAGDNTGAVYLFEFNGRDWVETGKLTPSRPTPGAKFGRSLAFDGELLAVAGAPEAGIVTIFQRGAGVWRELAQVPVPASADGEAPYVLLDLYGDTLALSTISWQEPVNQADLPSIRRTGVVSLYEREGNEWKRTFQTAPQEASLFRMRSESPFGLPVALGGEAGKASWLAVGKPGFTGSGREFGSVAIFERGKRGWKPQAELVLAPGEAVPGGLTFFGLDPGAIFFGAFVEIEGNRLSVVSAFDNTAYVFERQGRDWIYRFRLIPVAENGDPDDFQRRTVVLRGNSLLMGSPGDLGVERFICSIFRLKRNE
jgi:hypothetical protein